MKRDALILALFIALVGITAIDIFAYRRLEQRIAAIEANSAETVLIARQARADLEAIQRAVVLALHSQMTNRAGVKPSLGKD